MSPPVFLVDPADLAAARPGARLTLAGSEGRHAAGARRLERGERVDVTDGAGGLAACTVSGVRRDELDLQVVTVEQRPAPQPRLTVVQALAKGDRGELAVEMMTEAGVDVVVPWVAGRSVMQWKGERGQRSLDRWRSTAREAAKQARRAHFPEVTDLASTRQVAGRLGTVAAVGGLAGVLHEEASEPLAAAPVPATGEVVLVVGPEGGITGEELTAFEAAGARTYRLGDTVLRTSTAGVAALAVVLSRTSRWAAIPVSGR